MNISKTYLYADDTKLFSGHNDDLQYTLNYIFHQVYKHQLCQ